MNTLSPHPDVPLPSGAEGADLWEGDPPRRLVMTPVTWLSDSPGMVWVAAVQTADGSLDGNQPPLVHLDGVHDGLSALQARELACALHLAAARADGWTTIP